MELTDEDFEDVHEELLVKDSPVEVRQKDSVIVYLKIRVWPIFSRQKVEKGSQSVGVVDR